MDLTKRDLEQLAKLLGHDAKNPKEFYRLAHSTIELTKVTDYIF